MVDDATYTAKLGKRTLDLTFKEFELLKYLAQHPGRVFTREQLLQEVWGYDYFGGTRTVDVHVRRLRAKLGSDNEALIGTVRNVGYRFVLPPKEPQGRPRRGDRGRLSTLRGVLRSRGDRGSPRAEKYFSARGARTPARRGAVPLPPARDEQRADLARGRAVLGRRPGPRQPPGVLPSDRSIEVPLEVPVPLGRRVVEEATVELDDQLAVVRVAVDNPRRGPGPHLAHRRGQTVRAFDPGQVAVLAGPSTCPRRRRRAPRAATPGA